MLGDEDEVQPDLTLRILPEHGGQSKQPKFIEGAPELVAEVAYSSYAIDLHLKKERYRVAGVIEYLVLCLQPRRLYWFDFKHDAELTADGEGIFRSVVFPGLWIHGTGLLDSKHVQTDQTLRAGLLSSEHKRFVTRLAKRNR
jgi:Uma2 family endonuclease